MKSRNIFFFLDFVFLFLDFIFSTICECMIKENTTFAKSRNHDIKVYIDNTNIKTDKIL